MPHAPFFEALADSKEGEAEWELATIGYFLIRCLDDWQTLGSAQFAIDSGANQVRAKIADLSRSEARYAHVFREALDVLTTAPDGNAALVVAPFLAYGSLLEADGKWMLAADVYDTVATALSDNWPAGSSDTSAQGFARRREAYALRCVGDFDRAEVRYRQAILISERTGDLRNVHLSRIGLANLARVKGNLPEALSLLTNWIGDCEGGTYPQIDNALTDLRHTRGTVLHEMERYNEAIRDYFEAYQVCRDQNAKSVLLNDIASCAIHTGYFEFAHDALGLVLHRAEISAARQLALINLMYLAVAQDDEISFFRYQQQWERESGDVLMNATVRLVMAMGVEQFGGTEDALAAYQSAAQFAADSRVAKIQFDALAHIERIQGALTSSKARMPASATVPQSLWSVTDALAHEYRLAITHRGD